MDLAVAVYAATAKFPQSELYGLTSQMRRAATSVAANIAEGYGRESTRSYIQFLKTSRGSLKEVETLVILSERIKLLTAEQSKPVLEIAVSIGKMLNSLIRSLRDQLPGGSSED